MHPWYSPWHETIITDALATIGRRSDSVSREACRALTEQDANYFQRLAQILARYHKTKTPLNSIASGERPRLRHGLERDTGHTRFRVIMRSGANLRPVG